jgi:phosphatidylethanolamine-binding protein (PEBP) family uncharacterized protein
MGFSRYKRPRVAEVMFIVFVAIATAALAGCGGSSTHSVSSAATSAASGTEPQSAPATTPAKPTTSSTKTTGPPEKGVTVAIKVTVPVAPVGHPLPKRYTCDGEDMSLPVEWSGVPSGTAEIVLSVESTNLVNGTHLFFNWAVAGLGPTSHGVSAGALPSGVVVGRNGFGKVGYSICPPKGKGETFIIRVSALTKPIAAKPGFDPEALLKEGEQTAKVIGLGGTSYTRQ